MNAKLNSGFRFKCNSMQISRCMDREHIHEEQLFYLLPRSDSVDKIQCHSLGMLEREEKDAMLGRC